MQANLGAGQLVLQKMDDSRRGLAHGMLSKDCLQRALVVSLMSHALGRGVLYKRQERII